MVNHFRIGILLKERQLNHLGIPSITSSFTTNNCTFHFLNESTPLINQGCFDIILHKASDYIQDANSGDETALRIMDEISNYRNFSSFIIDNPVTVYSLANRHFMFEAMDACKFTHNGITVDVPKWFPLLQKDDTQKIKAQNFNYPLICKALCAGEGPGCHSMQLVFNSQQLEGLKIMPCIAQEFKNHNGMMVKLFVFGGEYFIFTRPSVRNFPINGQPLERLDSIQFDSHDVAKLTSKTFLNNYQTGFALKSTLAGDKILDDGVVKLLLRKIRSLFDSCLLGIDIIVTDNDSRYNLVDINFLPSFDGVENRLDKLEKLINDYISNNGPPNYWE